MWMAYSCQNWPTAEDLPSAIKRLRAEFYDLEFDRSHAANYDLNICYDSEALPKVLMEAERFDNGVDLCDQFLTGVLDINNFCSEIVNIGLKEFLSRVVDFLPTELIQQHQLRGANDDTYTSDTDDDDEIK